MFPRLFHIGSFYLPTYGVLVASGVLIGLWISVRNSEKQGVNGDDAWNLGILVVLAGIIGAKVLYIKALPWLDFQSVYGPFYISVGLMMWAFLSGLLVLAGAHFSATRYTLGLARQAELEAANDAKPD